VLNVAVAVGFEPTVDFHPHTLSSCELPCSGMFGRPLCGLLFRPRTSAHGGELQRTRLRLRLGLTSRPVPRVQATCPESISAPIASLGETSVRAEASKVLAALTSWPFGAATARCLVCRRAGGHPGRCVDVMGVRSFHTTVADLRLVRFTMLRARCGQCRRPIIGQHVRTSGALWSMVPQTIRSSSMPVVQQCTACTPQPDVLAGRSRKQLAFAVPHVPGVLCMPA
jgi:hypothetical protein